jgi:mannose-6-phosphate isomerase-like protein (cupin superfamily)
MRISRRENVDQLTVHQSVRVHPLLPRWSLAEETKGTYLEFIDDFEIDAGSKAEPHFHNTHEWYYVIEGTGVVQIEEEARRVAPGDLVYITPNAHHTIYPTGNGKIRALCFASSYQAIGGEFYTPVELKDVAPTET